MVPARYFLKLLVLVALGSQLMPGAKAQSGWQLCNETSFVLEASIARQDGGKAIVEGWQRLRPGSCATVLPAPLKPGPHFIYARSSKAHRGGERSWAGEFEHCVDATGSFSIESPSNCIAMGLEPRKFQPVLIESRATWTNTFRETEKYTRDKALAAGIQRLLDDAGVWSGTIDGYIGRRTRSAIREFLTDNNVSAEISDEELIDLLEQVAIDRSRNLGLTVCNRTEYQVWTAIGQRRGEGYESRGWWTLEAGGCERVIDEALIKTPYYIYGAMITDTGERELDAADEPFCISRAKFAILERDNCEARFYQSASFVATEEPDESGLVFEFFERDFAEKEGSGEGG